VDWEGRPESQNVEDRRGMGRKAGIAIGGIGGVIVLVIALFLGVDPQKLLGPGGQGPPQGDQPAAPADPAEERADKFTRVILRDTEVVWTDLFQKMGKQYVEPKLVEFTGQVDSACGTADAAVGPFYCPADSKVYIDLSFYREMERKLGAPGEFARAYVIAHEIGHHVQHLLGYSRRAEDMKRRGADPHEVSVRLELQADYFAGVWAYHGQRKFNFLQKGDIESAIKAAHQIGDDYLQKQARGRVMPDKFTHGSSEQRMRWLKEGFETGDVDGAAELFNRPYGAL
jgi:predicted metalloprotease